MAPFLKKSLEVFSLSVIGKVIAIFTTIAFARWMGPANLGSFSTFMAIVGLLAALALLGFPIMQMRSVARQSNTRVIDVFTPTTITGFGLLLVMSIFSILLAQLLQLTGWMPALSDLQNHLHILLPLALLGSTLPAYAGQTLVGMGYARTMTLINQIARPLTILVLAVMWMLMNEAWILLPETRIVMELLVALVFGLFVYGFLYKYSTLSFKPGTENLKASVFHATWISAFSFAGIGLSQVIFVTTDIIVLGFFVSPEQIGVYKVAAAAALLLLFPMNAMSPVFAPRIANHQDTNVVPLNKQMRPLILLMFALGFPLLTIFLFYPDLPIRLMFGDPFINAAPVLSILAIGMGVRLILGATGWGLSMTGHETPYMRILMSGAGLNLMLNMLLIPGFGEIGAAMATAVATIVTYTLVSATERRRTGMKLGLV